MRGAIASRWPSLLLALLPVFAFGVGAFALAPPEVVPADGPAQRFSGERAMQHLRELVQAPRPSGSEEHRRVRELLEAELRELGWSVGAQKRKVTISSLETGEERPLEAHNVLVPPVQPPAGTRVLLAAHYDTVPDSPGAADDGAGLAVLLEAARVLGRAPTRNQLSIAFIDAEELLLVGSSMLVRNADVELGFVVNIDCPGGSGPAVVIETGDRNALEVEAFGELVRRPVASSFAHFVYGLLPLATDFTRFRAHGVHGINLSLVGGTHRYHQPTDLPDTVDAASLQHLGDITVALARWALEEDLEAASAGARKAERRAYVDLFGRHLLHLPVGWVRILIGVLTVALLVIMWRGRRWPRPSAWLWLATLALSTALVSGPLVALARQVLAPPLEDLSRLALLGTGFALAGLLAASEETRTGMGRAGAFTVLLIGIGLAVHDPAAALTLVAPLSCATLGLALEDASGAFARRARLACGLAFLAFCAPTFHLLQLAAGLLLAPATAILALLMAPCVAVTCALCLPRERIPRRGAWILFGLAQLGWFLGGALGSA